MANALGTLFQNIASAIRDKTGETGTMKPAEFPEKIAAIETSGGEEDILLPTTELTFTVNDTYGNMWQTAPALCSLRIGKEYVVTWDGTDYTCEGTDLSAMMVGAVAIGNLAFVGGADTGEPFAFAYVPASGEGVVYDSNICLTGDTNLHTIKITKTFKTLTIKTGTFRAPELTTTDSEGNTITYANPYTATHDMGFVPDIILVWVNRPLVSLRLDVAVGFSNAMYEAFGEGSWSFVRTGIQMGTQMVVGTSNFATGFEGTEGSWQGAIRNVTSTSFTVGGDRSKYPEYCLIPAYDYQWMAIGGITG